MYNTKNFFIGLSICFRDCGTAIRVISTIGTLYLVRAQMRHPRSQADAMNCAFASDELCRRLVFWVASSTGVEPLRCAALSQLAETVVNQEAEAA
jgi:hypothetical protein